MYSCEVAATYPLQNHMNEKWISDMHQRHQWEEDRRKYKKQLTTFEKNTVAGWRKAQLDIDRERHIYVGVYI